MRLDWGFQGFVLVLAIGATACGKTPANGAIPSPTSNVPVTSGSASVPPAGTAGTGGPLVTTPSATAGTAAPQNAAGGNLPCDVASLVSENCTLCHSASPKYSAPMPLMTLADFMAASKLDPKRKVYEVIPERINATDVTRRMPPASGTALPAAGLTAFNAWLSGGLKPAAPGCAIKEKSGTTTMGTAGKGSEPTGMRRSGGATDTVQEYDDPLLKCYEFKAHADGNKMTPFTVSTQPDLYTNFTFMPPWQGMQYARSFRTLEGNNKVIHHWLFYKNAAAGPESVTGSSGAHPDGELTQGWAPGGSNVYYDYDVGQEMPGDTSYTLETHHNNMTGSPAMDNSGIEVCVTPTKPDKVVSLSWLGTDNINGASASGVCNPTSNVPIHIMGVSPHMHTKGRHMTAIITRVGGKTETLFDGDFDFSYQHAYYRPVDLMPGDSIKTTCTYSEPTRFGEGTNDEMCYMFTGYYPKLSLTNGAAVPTLIHGPNTCLE